MNIQANFLGGPNALWPTQPNQNFGWAMAHPVHPAASMHLLWLYAEKKRPKRLKKTDETDHFCFWRICPTFVSEPLELALASVLCRLDLTSKTTKIVCIW